MNKNNREFKEEDADFLHFYQTFKFQENSDEKFTVSRSKRMQLILNNLQSSKEGDELAKNFLLERDLAEYANYVDSTHGLNNYANYINELIKQSPISPLNDCNKWKSDFENSSNYLLKELNFPEGIVQEELFEKKIKPIYNDFKNYFGKLTISSSENKFEDQKMDIDQLRNFEYNNQTPMQTNSANLLNYQKNEKCTLQNEEKFTSDITNIATKSLCKELISSETGFRTATTELQLQNIKKNVLNSSYQPKQSILKRSLGRSVRSKFTPPIKSNIQQDDEGFTNRSIRGKFTPSIQNSKTEENDCNKVELNMIDENLRHLDPKMVELIKNEIMDKKSPVAWDDISGLEFAKKTIQEIVVWPFLRPDIFTGLRRPPKGILLFGPPGTGKTLIGKCIASQSSSTFFSISASSLTSKWIGESEKLVRTLFSVARCYQPAVIFIDEIDSLLSQRSETEHESSRRIKTEFLVQLDGATTHEDDRILVIGATNRPQELDEAARRRLVKRLYIPLPEYEARCQMVSRLMKTEKNELSDDDIKEISNLTDGYSGADMKNLCQEASLGPIRCIDFSRMDSIETHQVRPITLDDFKSALKHVKSSVSSSDLQEYLEWDKIYGSSGN